ncbi:MAG: 4-alpha-glucanotransferase [Bacteroidia bacterium]
MDIRFHIHYNTQYGQRLKVCGNHPTLGDWDAAAAPYLEYIDNGEWALSLDIDSKAAADLEYKFCIEEENEVRWEWGKNRKLSLPARKKTAHIRDYWRPAAQPENAWQSAAFTQVLMAHAPVKKQRVPAGAQLILRMAAPRIPEGYALCVLGSDPALGGWQEENAVLLNASEFPVWSTAIKLAHPDQPADYKFAIYDLEQKKISTWESGANRRIGPIEKGALQVVTNEKFQYPVGNWKGAGVAVPVFSLRSEQGVGVGEFADLIPFIDWAKETGLKMVQILPVNDTTATHTWTDSYPYAAISVFALHPMFLNVEAIGKVKDKAVVTQLNKDRERLNALPQIDYEGVLDAKWRYIRAIYAQDKNAFLKDKDFKSFLKENKDWLTPYAAFSALRERNNTVNYNEWNDHSTFNRKAIEAFCDPKSAHFDEVGIYYFIQYHLDRQLKEATAYGREKGIVLKGDIPIGIYRYSVDAWTAPELYNMDGQAGAPPDDFAVAGQNWGFPTYNWDRMAEDDYAWWRRRLSHMTRYFDAYRIDHILGFFRIWDIPWSATEGLLGRFNPALPMSRSEIVQRIGWFDEQRLCMPFIREYMLGELFGPFEAEVNRELLEETYGGQYQLKPHVSTQRKIEAFFTPPSDADQNTIDKFSRIKKGLLSLAADVIFLQDKNDPHRFHPRISMHHTRSYQALAGDAQKAINALYLHFFYKRHEDFWRNQAMIKLPGITEATDMLVCGEDLGMVPESVPGVMNELGLLSLEIQRMPKATGRKFGHPADAPYLSVISTGSHDMSTLRGWWEEGRAKSQEFFNEILGHDGAAPFFCEAWLVKEVVIQHLYSPAMWAVFPLQDLVGMDAALRNPDTQIEQINVPANPKHYWRYRFHMNTSELASAKAFNEMLRTLVDASGRNAAY